MLVGRTDAPLADVLSEDAVLGFGVFDDGKSMTIDVAGECGNEEVPGVSGSAQGAGVDRGRERRGIGFAGLGR